MWFKVEGNLVRNRKVKCMARDNEISHNEALGALLKLWSIAIDAGIEDGDITRFGEVELTDECGLEPSEFNIRQMMVESGLLDERDGHFYIHDWDKHGGASLRELRLKIEGGRKGGIITQALKQSNKDKKAKKKPPPVDKKNGSAKPKPELTPKELIALYNEKTPPEFRSVEEVSQGRIDKATLYLARYPTKKFWLAVFAECWKSGWLRSKVIQEGKQTFVGSYDWLMQKGQSDQIENFIKVYEGKYN